MKVICGIPDAKFQYQKVALEEDIPLLISANAFWNDKKKLFCGAERLIDLGITNPIVLDSAGFTAMKLFGGYRWSHEAYIDLVHDLNPEWWSAMDFCCEPEIAADSIAITKRIDQTVHSLAKCIACSITWSQALTPISPPTFILQGWTASDYLYCINMIEEHILSDPQYNQQITATAGGKPGWPGLIGVGSVCRRHLAGLNGLYPILQALDARLPKHVKLHLFGVKSKAVSDLATWDRIESVDSMAWGIAARRKAYEDRTPCTIAHRAETMKCWWKNQDARARIFSNQLDLLF